MGRICKPSAYRSAAWPEGLAHLADLKLPNSGSKIKKEDKERHEQLLNRAASRVSAREQQVRTKNCIHEKFP